MGKDWNKHKEEIVGLYLSQGKTLDDVMETMKERRGFKASKRAYRGRFQKWGVFKYTKRKKAALLKNEASAEKPAVQGIKSENPPPFNPGSNARRSMPPQGMVMVANDARHPRQRPRGANNPPYTQAVVQLSHDVGTAFEQYSTPNVSGDQFKMYGSAASSPSLSYDSLPSPLSAAESFRDQKGFESFDLALATPSQMTPSSSTNGMPHSFNRADRLQEMAQAQACQAKLEPISPSFDNVQRTQNIYYSYPGQFPYHSGYVHQPTYMAPQPVQFSNQMNMEHTYYFGVGCTTRRDDRTQWIAGTRRNH